MAQKKTSTSSYISSSGEPRVLNSLLRCIRTDNKASTLFQRIEKVPGLWVLELGPETDSSNWSDWLMGVQELLIRNKEFFTSLSKGSSDYTLHATVSISEIQRIKFPPAFSRIAAVIGVTIEIYRMDE